MIIYKITNLINGKVYIGQTIKTLKIRKKQHLKCAKDGVQTHLYQAIRKYGEDNFKFEIVRSAKSTKELNKLETYYITKFNSIKKGYNMVDGGNNNIMFIKGVKNKHDAKMRSIEVRNKISKSVKAYRQEHPFTKEHRQKLSQKAKGNHNFGTGDTRSIGCYCIINYKRYNFHSYKEAGIWWYDNYNPFNTDYSECTFQRKIKQCIKNGYCTYGRKPNQIIITKNDIQWFRNE